MDIRLEAVTKTYATRDSFPIQALDGVDAFFPAGSMASIMGPSGCGKSTLLNLIAGIDRPTSGQVFIGDQDIATLKDTARSQLRNRCIGYVLQGFELINTMNIRENVRLPFLFSREGCNDVTASIHDSLELVGLHGYDTRTISKLSGGQKQRVAIARAIVMNPSIVLADEPTGSLDSKSAQEIIELLKELNQTGHTVLIVTHNKDVAQACPSQYNMLDGKLFC